MSREKRNLTPERIAEAIAGTEVPEGYGVITADDGDSVVVCEIDNGWMFFVGRDDLNAQGAVQAVAVVVGPETDPRNVKRLLDAAVAVLRGKMS